MKRPTPIQSPWIPAKAGRSCCSSCSGAWTCRRRCCTAGSRTGQVRINGGRAKPFGLVAAGDAVRLPPFALGMSRRSKAAGSLSSPAPGQEPRPRAQALPPLPRPLLQDGDLWVFCKPAGLPTHPGTGHEDSLSSRLAARAGDAPLPPSPGQGHLGQPTPVHLAWTRAMSNRGDIKYGAGDAPPGDAHVPARHAGHPAGRAAFRLPARLARRQAAAGPAGQIDEAAARQGTLGGGISGTTTKGDGKPVLFLPGRREAGRPRKGSLGACPRAGERGPAWRRGHGVFQGRPSGAGARWSGSRWPCTGPHGPRCRHKH